jgi:hypothetical protein
MNYSNEFLDQLFLTKDRTVYTKIDLLSWDEKKIKEIQGRVISGSINIEGASGFRRAASLEFFLDRNIYSLSAAADELSINKKIRIFIGLENNVYSSNEAEIGEIIWFNMGIFLLTSINFSHTTNSNTISLQAQDKMAMLNGTLAGEIGANISFTIGATGEQLPYFYIIKDALVKFGLERESNVVISGVPIMIGQIQKATDVVSLFYDPNPGSNFSRTFEINPTTNLPVALTSGGGNLSLSIAKDEELNIYLPFSPGANTVFDFKSQATVLNILEKVKQDLFGIYDLYYDENGIFRFEPLPQLSNPESYQLLYLQDISNDKYYPDYSSVPYAYDFSDKGIISLFANSPEWMGIKNDFYVYGKSNILFHIVIDYKPVVPTEFYKKNSDGSWTEELYSYNQPWQQFIIDESEYLLYKEPGASISPYYEELKAFFEFQVDIIEKTAISGAKDSLDIVLNNVTGIEENMSVFGTGIGPNAKVEKISGTKVTLTTKNIDTVSGTIIFSTKEDTKLGIYKRTSETDGIWRSDNTGNPKLDFVDTPSLKKGVSSKWKYFFDILEEGAPSYNGFSVSAIGRRKKTLSGQAANEITTLFPTTPPDISRKEIIIFNNQVFNEAKELVVDGSNIVTSSLDVKNGDIIKIKNTSKFYEISGVPTNGDEISTGFAAPTHDTVGKSVSINGIIFTYMTFLEYNEDQVETENRLKAEGITYYSILKTQISNKLDDQIYLYENDAFSNMKSLIYTHTNYNDKISITSIPVYTLTTNKIINVLDLDTKIIGNYFINSINFALGEGAQMSIAAEKVY